MTKLTGITSLMNKEAKDAHLPKEQRVANYISERHELRNEIAETETKLNRLAPPTLPVDDFMDWAKAEELSAFETEKQELYNKIDSLKSRIERTEADIINLLPIKGWMIKVNVNGEIYKVGVIEKKNDFYNESKAPRLVIEYPNK